MANIVQLAIGVTPSLSLISGWLGGSFVGPDLTLRGGEGMHLVVCEGRIQCET